MRRSMRSLSLTLFAAAALVACGGDGDGHDPHDQELITTVILTFTPPSGTVVVATFDDPDGDGGDPPVVDPVDLSGALNYLVTVTFENRLEEPPEDITAEIADEADEHQVFFTGTAVDGPASDQPTAPLAHAYADEDVNGLPIGLSNLVNVGIGDGELIVTLRHLPPVNDMPVKTATTAAEVAAGGFAAIGGSSDVSVTFEVMGRTLPGSR